MGPDGGRPIEPTPPHSCVDCDLRETCVIAESNESCWGWCPSCADRLWAQDIVRYP